MTMGKVLLMGSVPLAWDYRLPILLAVVVIGSVGSHMPARLRYYSVLYREIIRAGCGPGALDQVRRLLVPDPVPTHE